MDFSLEVKGFFGVEILSLGMSIYSHKIWAWSR